MPNDHYDFELALALFAKENYEELWSHALPHAESGNSYAQCFIGFLYQFGLGGPADLERAEHWLSSAADQNNPVVWNNLGTLVLSRGEKERARQCYQEAVDLGFSPATLVAQEFDGYSSSAKS